MCKKYIFILILLSPFGSLFAQNQGNTWVFGDSAMISFNSGTAVACTTAMCNHVENSSAISDSAGDLLFFAGGSKRWSGWKLRVQCRTNSTTSNSYGLYGYVAITQGCIIVPQPESNHYYYVLHMDYDGIYSSLLDKNVYGSLGRIHIRNKVLLNSDSITEKMVSVRHGNGTDWWIIAHLKESNTFVKFICKSDSIHGPYFQSIGSDHSKNNLGLKGQMCISNDGTKLACVASNGLIEVFSFNRVTGELSKPISISDSTTDFYGCSFSPNNQFLYVSNANFDSTGVSSLYQYDLNSSDIASTRVLLSQLSNSNYHFGQHKLGPDGKIYIAKYNGILGSDFFVKDSNNAFLSVINLPNKLGTACQFLLNGVYLGGRTSSGGLPNIPNYNLGMIPEVAMLHPVEYPQNSQETDSPDQNIPNAKGVNIAVPSHFTPNQDGISDVFSITAEQLQQFDISVYNVSGALVYHSTNQYEEWNGSYGNVYSQTGIYVYAIKYTSMDGVESFKTGKVLLTR